MGFSSQSAPVFGAPEKQENKIEEVTLSPEVVWHFQFIFLKDFFLEECRHDLGVGYLEEGDITDEDLMWWAESYGHAFREYCVLHPTFARTLEKVYSGQAILSDEDRIDMVYFLKGNKSINPSKETDVSKYIH